MTITDLELGGLSCASCAARVERGLNQLDGVRATVNFAVERAHVEHDSDVSASDLIRAVESASYQTSVRSDRTQRQQVGVPPARGGRRRISCSRGWPARQRWRCRSSRCRW